MISSRRATGLTGAAIVASAFLWAGAGLVGFAPILGEHGGGRLDDLDGLAGEVEGAEDEQIESTPFRRDIVAGLHQHTNAVIWGGASPDIERFAQVVVEFDDRGAHDLAQTLERAMRLVDDGNAFAAHDLLAELEADLGHTP